MFERCRHWRRLLSQRADGILPDAQWVTLEQHLARCARCRQFDDADRALRDVLRIQSSMLDTRSAHAFDEFILAELREGTIPVSVSSSRLAVARQWAQSRWEAIPFPFLTQVAGGGLVAASVTMLCLLSSLHARNPVAVSNRTPEVRAALTATRNEPPVPLESLLRSPAPRAALLWTSPPKDSKRTSEDVRQ
jgi:hypothetical protein